MSQTAIQPLDMAAVIDQAYTLADWINQSEEVSTYTAAKERLKQDAEAQRLIQLFQQKKQAYEEVQRFGKYHPDFDKISRELRECKQKLDMLESVQAFKRAENRLDELLYRVGRTIADAVSPTVKVLSNNPIMEAVNSGCGTGGSCGCKTRQKAKAQ